MPRPQLLKGETPRMMTGCGFLYLTDNSNNEYPEILLKLGKTGCCPGAFLQALAMTASIALRYGVPKEKIIKQWRGIQCPSPTVTSGKDVLS